MSSNERVGETTLYGREEKSPEYGYDQLLHEKPGHKGLKISLLEIRDQSAPDNIIYNGGLYMDAGSLMLIARSERLDSEISSSDRYVLKGNYFTKDVAGDCLSESQDPSPFYHPDKGVMVSLVKTYSDAHDPERIIKYRSEFHPAVPDNRNTFFGPWGQKGLKTVAYRDHFLLTARNRQESMKNGEIKITASTSVRHINHLEDINPALVESMFLDEHCKISGFFRTGEWGNVTDCMLSLEDGRIGFMGHIAKFGMKQYGNERERHYAVITGILDPEPLDTDEVKIVLCSSDVYGRLPSHLPPKREDLLDVVYPRSMGFSLTDTTGHINLVGCCGLADRYTVLFETPWPFSVRPDLSAPSNSIFNYPADKIARLL